MPRMTQPEPLPGFSGSGSLSLPWRCASSSRKSIAALTHASARLLSRSTVVAASASPARSASAIRKCASSFSLRSAIIRLASLTSSARGLAAISSEQRVQPLLDRLVEQGIEHGRLPAGAVAQEVRKVEDGAEEILPLPLRGQVSGQPRAARHPRRQTRLRLARPAPHQDRAATTSTGASEAALNAPSSPYAPAFVIRSSPRERS